MKVATFNINGVNGRLERLLEWLAHAQPDVVCLQETKTPDARFPKAALARAGYGAVYRGERAYNGVAILARGADPIVTRDALPGDDSDTQQRYLEAAVSGVLIACLYAPNGNPQPGPKFDYKLAWLARLHAYAATLKKQNVPVVLAGDYNVAPTPADIYATKSWDNDALIQPAPRAAFAKLVKSGWTDAIRTLHPNETIYTFWDYKRKRWDRDAGLRIDHLLLSPALAPRLQSAGVDRETRGQQGASDHAPVWIMLKPAPKAKR